MALKSLSHSQFSAYNSCNLKWNLRYIDKLSFNINILTEPRAYNLQILPHEVKVLVEQKIENHINPIGEKEKMLENKTNWIFIMVKILRQLI